MKCPKCQFPNLKDAVFCSACGIRLEAHQAKSGDSVSVPGNSEITINVVEKDKPKKLGCFGIVFLVIIFSAMIGLISNAVNSGSDSQSSSVVSATPTQTKGSYCAILMKSLNEAIEYMGNAGSKYTVSDVAQVLEKRGNSLVSGFDVEMAGSAERLGWINDAGKQLLQIRVSIVDGGEITSAAEKFKKDYALIAKTCE